MYRESMSGLYGTQCEQLGHLHGLKFIAAMSSLSLKDVMTAIVYLHRVFQGNHGSKERTVFSLSVLSVCSVMVLMSTKWKPMAKETARHDRSHEYHPSPHWGSGDIRTGRRKK